MNAIRPVPNDPMAEIQRAFLEWQEAERELHEARMEMIRDLGNIFGDEK